MKATLDEAENYLSAISATPRRIELAVKGCKEAQLLFKEGAGSWSANDILAHLRSCADLWTHSIYAMLAANEPVFSDIDERKWARITRYAQLPFHESLQSFTMQRENLVRVLRALPFESWERSAIISKRKHTIFTQTRRMAKHEDQHCRQIEELLRHG